MIWLFLIVGVLVVVVVGFVAVGAAVGRLEGVVVPAVFEVDDAVDWVAERLPPEAAGQLSRDDVLAVVGWYLEYFDSVGLATRHGQELGEAALDEGAGRVVARQDDAVDAVVARGLGARVPLDAVSMVVVVDLLGVYLAEMGAIGGSTGPDPTAPDPGRPDPRMAAD